MASHFLLFNVLCAVEGVTFLFPNKKVTKEIGIGEALRKGALPYVPHPPLRHPTPENVPIFGCLHRETFRYSQR